MAQRPQVIPSMEKAKGQGAPSRKIGLWVGLGAGLLVVCVLAVGGTLLVRNNLATRAAIRATQTAVAIPIAEEITPLAPTTSLAAVTSPVPSDTPVASPVPSETLVPSDTPVPMAPTATQPAARQAVFKINANIRSGPGTLYPILTVYTAGTQIDPLGRNHAGDWLAFSLPGGKQGWAALNALQVDFDVSTLAELNAPPPPTQPPVPTATPSSGGGGSKPTVAPP